ncbi:MAG: hypothetical protein Q9169_008557, partial [Polycauliona sp. 2 TL-2023]
TFHTMTTSQAPASRHRALHLNAPGTALQLAERPTPTPGPGELLIAVYSIALNPLDHVQRDLGIHVQHYPSVLGSDVAGTIATVGPTTTTYGAVAAIPKFTPGMRVAIFATAFFEGGAPNYGALQEFVLVPSSYAVPLPEEMTFDEAASLPMAVQTAWYGWYTIGLLSDRATSTPEKPYTFPTPLIPNPASSRNHKSNKKEAVLIWGGSSSVGSACVQIAARSLGYIVYTTASAKHHAYLRSLGASHLFDYRDSDVVDKIINTAKSNMSSGAHGPLRIAYDAAGSIPSILAILTSLNPEESATEEQPYRARLASAPLLSDPPPRADGVEIRFVQWPEPQERREAFASAVFNDWLHGALEKGVALQKMKKRGEQTGAVADGMSPVQDDGAFVPSPAIRIQE